MLNVHVHLKALLAVLSRIVKTDQITNTEYIRFLINVRIPNTEYIRFLKMIEYRIPNSTIQMLLLLVSILRVLIGISLSLTASVSGL